MSLIIINEFWIETELCINNLEDYEKEEILSSTNNKYTEYNGIMVCKDNEFYNSQVEYKMFPKPFSTWNTSIETWKKFIQEKIKDWFLINGTDWVGTHIHFFLRKEDGKPLSFMYNVKVPIIHYMMKKLLVHLASLEYNDKVAKLEIERIVRSHSIWRWFDKEVMGDVLRHNMQLFGFDYRNFSNGTSKKKYQPVLWSFPSAETWKPLSLELRMIPNSYLLNSSSLNEDKKFIEYSINNRVSTSSDEYNKMKYEIGIIHLALCNYISNFDSKAIEYVRKQLNF